MARLEALGLTVRQELLHLDLERGEVGERRRLANVEDRRGLIIGLDRRPRDNRVYLLTGLTEMTEQMTLLPLPATATADAGYREQVPEIRLDLPLPDDVLLAFDPSSDSLRAITTSGRSFRIDPVSGALRDDVPLRAPGAATTPRFSAAAYGAVETGGRRAPLYLIDVAQRLLYIEDPREPGRLEVIGELGVPLRQLSALRLFPVSEGGQAAILVDGNLVYTLDLLSGRAWDRTRFDSQDLVIVDMAPL